LCMHEHSLRLLQLAEEDIDMKSLPDRIKIEYRTRIEKETAGLGAQEAALVTRKLEDEKEMHLNDLPSYVRLLHRSTLHLRTHSHRAT